MKYIAFLREIRRGMKLGRRLPPAKFLISNVPRWVDFQKSKDVFIRKTPWLTFSAIDYLNSYLTPQMKVFEFGGGGSTLYFLERTAEVVTVEHHEEWYDALKKKIEGRYTSKWNGNFVQPDSQTSLGRQIGDPDEYFSDDPLYENQTFRTYASFIDKFPDEYFDVVLIDGRARPSCLKHSLSKVRLNGLLTLDNAERHYYLDWIDGQLDNYTLMQDWFGPTPYSQWFSQTNIWQRVH